MRTSKSLKIPLMLALCLCALLLCGGAPAEMEMYSVNIENFDSDVMPYCLETELSNEYGSEINSGGIGAMVNQNVTIRIVPSENCSVDAIAYRYTEDGYTLRENCTLRTDASGAVTTSFRMPPANVTVTVTMSREGEETYEVQGSFLNCTGTLSDGGQTGSGSLFVTPGSTLTVTAVPAEWYSVGSMTYTTFHDASPRTIAFTVDQNGVATGTLTMPEDRVFISVSASIHYLSYNASGVSQGMKPCTDYRLITNGSDKWYDLNTEHGGWYIVQGTVTMSSDTTIRVTGDVHLILCDGATLNANDGIYIKKGSSLSIYGQRAGTGKLVAKPDGGPGIGGMADTVAGSLYIHGGDIDAKGGTNAAGIGGGNHASGYQNIVIYGGRVKAEGGSSGAGIGKGQQNSPSDCGLIEIYGGAVTAKGGMYGAGIGGGEDRDGGTIRIWGGTVTATGNHDSAGIGGGEGGSGGDIRIYGGTVIATGGNYAAGIGGGERGNSGTIQIHGGSVEAYGAVGKDTWEYGAGIGGGKAGKISPQVLITGGTVYAEGGETSGAGIGSASAAYNEGVAQGGDIIITGGSVTAVGGDGSAGIGGAGDYGDGGKVTIEGGQVEARGGENAAGIGGGRGHDWGGNGGSVTITAGTVTAIAGPGGGAGVGGSRNASGGTFVIRGGSLTATGGDGGGAGVGGGRGGLGGDIRIEGGTVIASPDPGQGGFSYAAEALGNGLRNNSNRKGSLSLYPGARVSAEIDYWERPYESSLARDRIDDCRLNRTITISPCDHRVRSYTVTASTHTIFCPYCTTEFQPEEHTFANGRCTVCRYEGTSVTVTYLPGHEHAVGTMSQEGYVPNKEYVIAACEYEVSGYVFSGWLAEDTGAILQPGQTYTLTADLTLTATWRSDWSDLQADINAAEGGTVIPLHTDMTAGPHESALTIPAGKDIILELNGFTLSRGLTEGTEDGFVLCNEGTLTIRDSAGGGSVTGGCSTGSGGGIVNSGTLTIESGAITGNRAAEGGAVFNAAGATLTITGGTLSGNTAATYSGGAVVNRGTMNISGGTISGNASKMNGAGVWSAGTINLSGGAITSNTTGAGQNGGGIFCSAGTLNLSGAPVVSENNVRNLYLTDNAAVQIAGALEPGLRIGLSVQSYPASADTPKVIASGVTGCTGGFVCDRDGYTVFVNSTGELILAMIPAFGTPDFTLPEDITVIEANAFEGAAMTVVSIPDGCESIGDSAFKDCQSLIRIRVPDNCALGADVFSGCGTVFVYGTAGSPAETYCEAHDNCVFVGEQ